MRSLLAGLRSLILPGGALPSDPAIVLVGGTDVPAELITFYVTVRGYTLPAVIIQRRDTSNYQYLALIVDAIGTPITAIGSVVAGVVHHQRTEHWSIPFGVSAIFLGEPGGETVHQHIVNGSLLIVDSGAQLQLKGAAVSTVLQTFTLNADTDNRLAISADGKLRWGSGAAAGDTVLYRGGADRLTTEDWLRNLRATSGDFAYSAMVSGDSDDRLVIQASGALNWGPGNAAQDTNLFRAGASVLQTDDTLNVALALNVGGNAVVLGIGDNRSKVKTADETINNTATFQNDDHLAGFAVEANATYRFRHSGVYNTSAVADLKLNYQGPTGVTGGYCGNSRVNGAFSDVGLGAGVLQGDGAISDFDITGWISTAGTAGTVNVQWAQATAEVSNTTMKDGTQFELSRVT